jgi:hypothetical protein
MADSKTVGREFLAGVLAKIADPAARAQAEAAFTSAEDAVAELGAGVLRQQDYSRHMDALKTKETEVTNWHSQLTSWHVEQQDRVNQALADAEAAKAAAGIRSPASPAAPPASPAPVGLTKEDLQKELDAFGNLALGVMSITNRLTAQHMKEFGEVLDPQVLLTHPKSREIGLDGVYREVFKEQLAKKAADAEALRVKAIQEAAVADYRSKHPNLPYPVSAQVQPSTLDALESGQVSDPSKFSVDAAVNEYHALVAQKLGPQPTGV